jgi:asparagine synthase (glutamine-hydrolysing)
MCGICGIIYFDRGKHVERATLEAMNHQIFHRGPDEAGFYISENIGLAMRRLSIIDVKTGQQPMTNEDETIWLVYNGEIYNHGELHADLVARGHKYRTRCDTETIVHLYEEYGKECVKYLRGMFAFSLWDSRKRRLFIARDRLGIKPLYYQKTSQSFIWGSEIKALLAFPESHAELNRKVLPEYLAFGYLAGSRTMFDGIQKLLPGHRMEVDEKGHVNIEQYWDLKIGEPEKPQPAKYYVQIYRDMLEQAVQSHLMSDVPLGVFLSGGLDSSAIAALMTKARREPIETFSVGYDEEAYSELSYARIVAEHIGSVHHEVRINRQEFFDSLPKLIWHEDEPLVWPSSVSLFHVSRLAGKHVKVVLTGEGADETLAGYTRYPWTLWNTRFDNVYRHLTPAAFRGLVRDAIAGSSRLNADLRRKLQHTFVGRDGASWTSFYLDSFYSAFSEGEQAQLLVDGLKPTPGAAYRDSLAYWEKSSGDLLSRLLYADIKTYLVELCMKQDNMSMAASVESRVPFLDHELVEFAARIPGRLKVSGLAGKCILKSSVRDLLPDKIVNRRKMGFPTPFARWLAGSHLEIVQGLLLEPRTLDRGLFKPEAVKNLLDGHRAKQWDHGDKLWRLLNLELWHRVFVDQDSTILQDSLSRTIAGAELR